MKGYQILGNGFLGEEFGWSLNLDLMGGGGEVEVTDCDSEVDLSISDERE